MIINQNLMHFLNTLQQLNDYLKKTKTKQHSKESYTTVIFSLFKLRRETVLIIERYGFG